MDKVTNTTGELFGNLFQAFDDENFKRSVSLFEQRFKENNFDLNFFKGKNCLDLGCGGGRYSIALSLLGAKSVTGLDVSATGIADAKMRAEKMNINNTTFIEYNGDVLPFNDEEFDCIIWSGVLMHMKSPELSVSEVSRVLKKSGLLYMLVYATEGLRWPLVSQLRNITKSIPFEKMDEALQLAGLDVNKRRTYLDDLYVPIIDFYTLDRLQSLLNSNSLSQINRWKKGRLDHEESLDAYIKDLNGFLVLFKTAATINETFTQPEQEILNNAAIIIESIINYASNVNSHYLNGSITEEEARQFTIGQGHHRIVCYKD